MNLFDDKLLKDTIQSISNPITINPNDDDTYTIKGFITNATLNSESTYHLHSLEPFNRGDVLTINDNDYYMVTSDIVMQRGSKYKGIIEYCNYKNPIIVTETDYFRDEQGNIVYNEYGEPVLTTVETIVGYNYGIMKYKSMTEEGTGIIVAITELILTLRDKETNRTAYAVNNEVLFEGQSWKVREQILTNQGLLQLRLGSN